MRNTDRPRDRERRRFIGAAAMAAGDLLAGGAAPAGDGPLPTARGAVALARGEGVGREPGGPVDQALLRRWFDEMLVSLTGAGSARDAWSMLFPRRSRVGIKLNCLAGPRLSPRRELVEALVDGLSTAGVHPGRVLVWERSDRELERCGFAVNTGGDGPLVYGTDNRAGGGYEGRLRSSGSVGSCFSRILTEQCDLLINVGVLKDHDLAGVSVGLKNLYGVIHNPNKYHDATCDPYVAELAAHPLLREKLRLTVCDATTAQCQGGPAFHADWAWNFGGVLAALDPVALDLVGAGLIEERRREKGLPSLAEDERRPTWIGTAGRLGLGESDPERIRRKEVG